MRSSVDRNRAGRTAIAAIAALALAGCGAGRQLPAAPLAANGPQADFPVVVGAPYEIAGVIYTPEDVLNYDRVGYLAADAGAGVTAAHHTLPLPSYVEITSLQTGRTILVRVERRGPMDTTDLVALAPAALDQLGEAAGAPVRVRRVVPPEDQRALLRQGLPAQARLDTPMPLVEVLRRQLPEAAPLPAAAPSPADRAPVPESPVEPATVVPAAPVPAPTAAPAPAVVASGFQVQAASFRSEERAANAARALDGTVSPSGGYFRVRTGPFATRAEAEASLAKVRAAGYSDARILISG